MRLRPCGTGLGTDPNDFSSASAMAAGGAGPGQWNHDFLGRRVAVDGKQPLYSPVAFPAQMIHEIKT